MKKELSSVIMELIIYATFLLLSLIAYAARQVANKGEEKKVSVSNINFKRYFFSNFGHDMINSFSAFRRVFSLYTSLPCLVTGCRAPMFINCTRSTDSKSPRSPFSMLPASHQASFLGRVPDPLRTCGAGERWWGFLKILVSMYKFFDVVHQFGFSRRLHFRSFTPFAAWPRWAQTSGGWWLAASLEVANSY